MADCAYMLNPDGSKKIVYAKDLKQVDQNKQYYCCCEKDGRCCGAPLTLAISNQNNIYNYFTLTNHAQPHMIGCDYDKSAIGKTVRSLDYSGTGTNLSQLLRKFNRLPRSRMDDDDVFPVDNDGRTANIIKSNEVSDVIPTKRQPSNFAELVTLLLIKNPDSAYGNSLVKDLLVAPKTFPYFLKNINFETKPLIIIGRKTKASLDFPRNDEEKYFILAAPDSYQSNLGRPILFIIRTNQNGYNKLMSANRDDFIAVIGDWHPVPVVPAAYICDHIQPSCIYILSDDLRKHL